MSVEAKADIPMVVLRDNGPKERNASINSGTTAGNYDDDDAGPVVDRNLVGCFGLKWHAIDQELNSIHITWDGDDDPGNPRNWPRSIRLRLSGILSILVALPIVHTTMLAPAGLAIRDALHLKDTESMQWVVSFANLAGGIGPLFIAPQSEVYGRRYMVHGCTFLFLAFNTGSGFAHTQWQLGTCRSLAAFFGCALKPIASGVLADCFKKTEMGIATAMFAAVPLILPSLGPVGGGYVVEHAGWKWICYGLSILGIIAQVVAYWFVPETFPPIILHKKVSNNPRSQMLALTDLVTVAETRRKTDWKPSPLYRTPHRR
jgi:MFS family permease